MPGMAVFLDTGFAIALASQRGIQEALAADIHFQQAGFLALLLET